MTDDDDIVARAVHEWREDGVLAIDTLMALNEAGLTEKEIERLACFEL